MINVHLPLREVYKYSDVLNILYLSTFILSTRTLYMYLSEKYLSNVQSTLFKYRVFVLVLNVPVLVQSLSELYIKIELKRFYMYEF
jgi:hypothetical protein